MKRQRSDDQDLPNSKRQNTGYGLWSTLCNIGNTIYSAFTSTPAPEGIITQIPNDLRFSIIKKLPFESLQIASQVSKNFNLCAMQVFNQYLLDIPKYFYFGQPNLSPQQKLLCFSSVRNIVAQQFPHELTEMLGLVNTGFACIQDKSVVLYAKVQSAEADEGKIVSVHYRTGYSRFTDGGFLCSYGDLLPHDTVKRIPGTDAYWPAEVISLEYLRRLVKGEPCGEVIDCIEQPVKITTEGHSIVRLCDKVGNILDFTSKKNKNLF